MHPKFIRKCSVLGCTATNSKSNENFCFAFPLDEPECLKIWLRYLDRPEFRPTEFDFICCNHFRDKTPTESNPYPELRMKSATEQHEHPPDPAIINNPPTLYPIQQSYPTAVCNNNVLDKVVLATKSMSNNQRVCYIIPKVVQDKDSTPTNNNNIESLVQPNLTIALQYPILSKMIEIGYPHPKRSLAQTPLINHLSEPVDVTLARKFVQLKSKPTRLQSPLKAKGYTGCEAMWNLSDINALNKKSTAQSVSRPIAPKGGAIHHMYTLLPDALVRRPEFTTLPRPQVLPKVGSYLKVTAVNPRVPELPMRTVDLTDHLYDTVPNGMRVYTSGGNFDPSANLSNQSGDAPIQNQRGPVGEFGTAELCKYIMDSVYNSKFARTLRRFEPTILPKATTEITVISNNTTLTFNDRVPNLQLDDHEESDSNLMMQQNNTNDTITISLVDLANESNWSVITVNAETDEDLDEDTIVLEVAGNEHDYFTNQSICSLKEKMSRKEMDLVAPEAVAQKPGEIISNTSMAERLLRAHCKCWCFEQRHKHEVKAIRRHLLQELISKWHSTSCYLCENKQFTQYSSFVTHIRQHFHCQQTCQLCYKGLKKRHQCRLKYKGCREMRVMLPKLPVDTRQMPSPKDIHLVNKMYTQMNMTPNNTQVGTSVNTILPLVKSKKPIETSAQHHHLCSFCPKNTFIHRLVRRKFEHILATHLNSFVAEDKSCIFCLKRLRGDLEGILHLRRFHEQDVLTVNRLRLGTNENTPRVVEYIKCKHDHVYAARERKKQNNHNNIIGHNVYLSPTHEENSNEPPDNGDLIKQLIKEAAEFPFLWDCNRSFDVWNRKAWRMVSEKLGLSVKACLSHWSELKSRFATEFTFHQYSDDRMSGWTYYEQMMAVYKSLNKKDPNLNKLILGKEQSTCDNDIEIITSPDIPPVINNSNQNGSTDETIIEPVGDFSHGKTTNPQPSTSSSNDTESDNFLANNFGLIGKKVADSARKTVDLETGATDFSGPGGSERLSRQIRRMTRRLNLEATAAERDSNAKQQSSIDFDKKANRRLEIKRRKLLLKRKATLESHQQKPAIEKPVKQPSLAKTINFYDLIRTKYFNSNGDDKSIGLQQQSENDKDQCKVICAKTKKNIVVNQQSEQSIISIDMDECVPVLERLSHFFNNNHSPKNVENSGPMKNAEKSGKVYNPVKPSNGSAPFFGNVEIKIKEENAPSTSVNVT